MRAFILILAALFGIVGCDSGVSELEGQPDENDPGPELPGPDEQSSVRTSLFDYVS